MIFKSTIALLVLGCGAGSAFAGGSGFPPITMPTMVDGTAPVAASDEPGSVLVFPEFIQGTINMFPIPAPGSGSFTAAQSLFKITAQTPDGLSLPEGKLFLHGHWVCGGTPNDSGASAVCQESDWVRTITFGDNAEGTITVNPSGTANPPNSDINGTTVVQPAPCDRGYLLVYASDSNGVPIKFDGLTGQGVLRNPSGMGEAKYRAIAIQADPALATFAHMLLGPASSLVFDGKPSHYLETVGQARGQVSWESSSQAPLRAERLVFLTLDTLSGLPNTPTFIPISFFNFYENNLSDGVAIWCWREFELKDISSYLTVEGFGSDNNGIPSKRTETGNFRTDQATDINGVGRTLLGLERENLKTTWGGAQSIGEFFNNSVGVPTSFAPKQ